jgi:hypothetical protein
MKTSHRRVSAAAAVVSAILLGLPSLGAAQELRVIDTNGVDVGVTAPPVPNTGYDAVVMLHVNSDWVPVSVTRAGFIQATSAVQFTFLHEGVDCSGPRYWVTAGNSIESLFAYLAKIYALHPTCF